MSGTTVPLRVLTLGATGETGREIVAQALAAGHAVTAFVRTPSALTVVHDRLQTIAGALPADAAGFAAAMSGHDVVVSALGRGSSLRADGLIARSVPVMLEAMRAGGVRRLIFTSAIGVGSAYRDAPLFSKLVIRLLLRDLYADKLVGETLIVGSDLDWTIVQPAQLTDGPLTGLYRADEALKPRGIPKISRADVAHFILGELSMPRYARKVIRLAY